MDPDRKEQLAFIESEMVDKHNIAGVRPMFEFSFDDNDESSNGENNEYFEEIDVGVENHINGQSVEGHEHMEHHEDGEHNEHGEHHEHMENHEHEQHEHGEHPEHGEHHEHGEHVDDHHGHHHMEGRNYILSSSRHVFTPDLSRIPYSTNFFHNILFVYFLLRGKSFQLKIKIIDVFTNLFPNILHKFFSV